MTESTLDRAADKRPAPRGSAPADGPGEGARDSDATAVAGRGRRDDRERAWNGDRTAVAGRDVETGARVVRVGLLGLGNVGQAVARLIGQSRRAFLERGARLTATAAFVRDPQRQRGFIPPGARVTNDPLEFFGHEFDVVIESLGGVEAAYRYVRGLLRRGVHVVTANKSLLAAHGEELYDLAAARGVTLGCEASALAGVPFLGSLRDRPLVAGVNRVAGVLNGTSNYILSALAARRQSLEEALSAATRLGYAEPDPSADLSGRDAAEKLVVILQHLGVRGVRTCDFEVAGIHSVSAADLRQARALGGTIRPVASATIGEAAVEAFVGPAFVPLGSPLSQVVREQNGILLEGPRVGRLFFSGPGAGPDVTAGTILDDVAGIVSGARAGSRGRASRAASPAAVAGGVSRAWRAATPDTGWFVRVRLADRGTRFIAVPEFLESRGVSVRQMIGAPPSAGNDLLYLLTARSSRASLETALSALSLETGCGTFAMRVIDTP